MFRSVGALNTRAWGPKGPWKLRWMKYLHGVLHGMKWIMFQGLLDVASILHLKVVGEKRPEDHDTLKSHNLRFLINYCVEGPAWIGWWQKSVQLKVQPPTFLYYTHRSVTAQKSNSIFHSHGNAFRWVSRVVTISWSRPLTIVGRECHLVCSYLYAQPICQSCRLCNINWISISR